MANYRWIASDPILHDACEETECGGNFALLHGTNAWWVMPAAALAIAVIAGRSLLFARHASRRAGVTIVCLAAASTAAMFAGLGFVALAFPDGKSWYSPFILPFTSLQDGLFALATILLGSAVAAIGGYLAIADSRAGA
jgi:hypothetical protein